MHYHSRRSAIYATHGCVATSQPLATSIGLQILREFGGNAADASVAIAAALAVLEPCSTGLGGDMMAMHYDASTHTVSAINGSGRSPAALSLDDVLQKNRVGSSYRHSSITSHSNNLVATTTTTFETGVDSITVPGAAQGWEDVYHKFGSGRLTFSQLLEPAARLAECVFPVSTMTSKNWSDSMNLITQWYTPDEITKGKVELSVDGKGTGPKPGQLFRNVGLANVLRQLGQKGAKEGFYDGPPGKAIVNAIQRHGGSMTVDDLKTHSSTFVEPVHVEYHGINVWEVPPNGQGVAGLIALEGLNALEKNGMVESSSSSSSFNQDESLLSHSHPPQTTVDMLHAQIEMMRLGFGDARAYVCDPDYHV
jgi:gamma-glutamyltranspeptidase/glutathione hydrolase